MRRHIPFFRKGGYETESHDPSSDDNYAGLIGREHWVIASWKPAYETVNLIGNSEQTDQLLAEMKARLAPIQGSRKEGTDLTDEKHIKGNWIDASHECAHSILQESQLRGLIKLEPKARVDAVLLKIVQGHQSARGQSSQGDQR